MNKREFLQWFREQVQTRWPTWEVNRCILGDWFEALKRYDVTILTEAVRRHHIRDDPARPRIGKVRALARELRVASVQKAPRAERVINVVTSRQFWQIVRATFPRRRRMALMKEQIKFDPRARDRDPEAYAWVIQERTTSTKPPPRSPPP
ncbi:MAG: hypothetical protein JSW27_06260 [Phycisphaerales bacterium]|nr:MAG: hypothetical protein JSW27_06260 [Phycisphaerales bacterium]